MALALDYYFDQKRMRENGGTYTIRWVFQRME